MKDNICPVRMSLDDWLQVEGGEGDVPHGVVGLQRVGYVGVTLKSE